VSMSDEYAKVLLDNNLPSEKFIFLTCGIKKKISYMRLYLSTQYSQETRQMKISALTKPNLMSLSNTPQPLWGCLLWQKKT